MKTVNGQFYKSGEDRTSNTRVLENGETAVFDCIEAEYRAVERLYSISELVVEPYQLDLNDTGEPEGYFMQELEGEPLEWYLNPERSGRPRDIDADRVSRHLEEFMEAIIEAEEPHGDLNPGNIMVHGDSSITVFDPVGYPEDFEWSRGELRKDQRNVDEMLERLEDIGDRKLVQGPGNRTEFRL